MNEEREQILNMLAAGKISVDDAQQLLESLEKGAGWKINSPTAPEPLRVEIAPPLKGKKQSKHRSRKSRRGPVNLIDQVLEMRIHGIDGRFVRGLHEMGFTDLTIDQLKQLGIHGVTPEYIRAIRDAGFDHISADELISFSIHDVTPEFVQEMAEAGFGDLSAEQITGLAIHDVSSEYIHELAGAGLKNLSVDQLIDLSIHDVDADFLKELVELELVDVDKPEHIFNHPVN